MTDVITLAADVAGWNGITSDMLLGVLDEIKFLDVITYDAKKVLCCSKIDINFVDDLMIEAYLLNLNIKDEKN